MDDRERLQLSKMIKANNVEDVTESIREKKHSQLIKKDIQTMINIKEKYQRLAKSNPGSVDKMIESQCNFLFTNYTDIYNRLKKDELDLDIMGRFLHTLERIENGEIDQHEGAFAVGKLLKDIYIDSALKRSEHLDKKNESNKKVAKKPSHAKSNMSYQKWKMMQDSSNANASK
jgi:hypothetical protein